MLVNITYLNDWLYKHIRTLVTPTNKSIGLTFVTFCFWLANIFVMKLCCLSSFKPTPCNKSCPQRRRRNPSMSKQQVTTDATLATWESSARETINDDSTIFATEFVLVYDTQNCKKSLSFYMLFYILITMIHVSAWNVLIEHL